MDRLHIEVPKVNSRTVPEEKSPNLSSITKTEHSLTPNSVSQGNSSSGMNWHPCFNRRIFTPNCYRPNQREFSDKAAVTHGEILPTGHLMKYMEWGPGQLELDRFTQRYKLQNSYTKSPSSSCSPVSPQPEDLTMSAPERLIKSEDEEEDEEIDMDDDDDDEPCDQSKPASSLKFSIANILGSTHKRKTRSDQIQDIHSSLHDHERPESPASISNVVMDPEASRNRDKECSTDEKSLESLLTDSDRYSWLQCTRYKPPKLPRSKKKDGSKKRKLGRNPRVPFTQHQVSVLEQKFRQTHYLSSVDVAELSAALNLTETRVKIWFQNRRARERRDRENIQLLQSGSTSTVTGSAPKHKPLGADRLSPELGSASQRSPRDLTPEGGSTGPSGLYPQRLHMPGGGMPGFGLGGLAGSTLPPVPWHSPLLPKPNILAQFAGSHRTSAFTPVTYFSYS